MSEEILVELKAIRELLEWQKRDSIEARNLYVQDAKQTKADMERVMAETLEKAKQNNRELIEAYYLDHVAKYHTDVRSRMATA